MATNNNFDALLAIIDKEEEEAREKAKARREEMAANRENAKEVFINDTTLAVVKGYNGCSAYTAINVGDGKLTPTKTVDNGLSNQQNTIAAISLAVKNFLAANNKDRLVIYAYGSEVIRVSGFLKKIKEGSDEVFTKDEAETINTYSKVYGNTYVTLCHGLFGLLKEANEKGKLVRLVSTDTITGTPIMGRLPVDKLKNKTVFLSNGQGKCDGYTIRLQNSNLNGYHKIVEERGQLKVTRGDINSKEAMEKMPEAFWANKLYFRVSNAINDAIDARKEIETTEQVAA